MSVKSKMTAIADKIRALLGITETMGLDAMADNIQAAQNEVDAQGALITHISELANAKAEGIIPAGWLGITENGMYNVTEYANVDVYIPPYLPNALNAITSGSFTLEADHTSENGNFSIEHGLGRTPNFFFVFADSATIGNPWPVGSLISLYGIRTQVDTSNNIVYSLITCANYIFSNGGVTSSGHYSVDSSYYCKQDKIILNPSSWYFKAGVTYRWFCGHTNNLTD